MKFFKKPVVAVILAIIIIATVSISAARMKMQKLSNEVIYGFYDGVYYNGEMQESIESRLRTIIEDAHEIHDIAESLSVDPEDLYYAIDSLELGFRYSGDDINYLYYCYDELIKELKDIRTVINAQSLSADVSAELSRLYSDINEQSELIKTSGYNESVKEFDRENDSELFEWFAWHTNVMLPEPFSRG